MNDPLQVTYVNLRFRAHADAEIVPIVARGDCQAPVLLAGDFCFYAPAVAPMRGDYAVIDVLVDNINSAGAAVGSDRKQMIKRLRAKADGSLWWYEKSGAFAISEHHKVLGTIMLAVRSTPRQIHQQADTQQNEPRPAAPSRIALR